MADTRKHEREASKDEESLATTLTPEQRSELTLLIATATASMRRAIENNFDPKATLSSVLAEELASENDRIMNPNIDTATVDVEQLDRERRLQEQREKELTTPTMQELKESCLKFFDEWCERVMERVGEAVNSKEVVSSQLRQAAEITGENCSYKPIDKKVNPEAPSSRSVDNARTLKAMEELYPPIATPLTELPEPKRILVLHSMLLLLLSLEHYTAPSRILLLYLTSSLRLELSVLIQDEEKVAQGLLEDAKELSGTSETQKKAAENQMSRKWKVGLASVAGASIIGVTGGLAAPLVAAGVGSVMGGLGLGATAAAGYLGSVAGSTVLVGGLFGAYGGRMTGQMMDNYAREVEDFAFLPIRGSRKRFEGKAEEAAEESGHRRLRVAIGVSGWLTEKEEVLKPWRVVGKGAEVFALKWELEALLQLGNSMTAMVSSAAWGYAKSEIIKRTIFADMMGALWPLGLLKISRVVDNPFSVAKSRADKTGEVLADALINKAQGERPVTLIGYSLGARVIYSCLMSLARRRAFGLVESAVLIGTPAPSSTGDWRLLRTLVSGRLVNVYSENDYVLAFLYRTSSIQYGVAGLQKIEGVPNVENIDVSDTVSGHLRYRFLVGSILKKIGFEDVELAEVEKEEAALKELEEEEKKASLLQKQMKLGEFTKKSQGEDADQEADNMEREVHEKTQKSLLQRAAEQLHISIGVTEAATDTTSNTARKSYYQMAADQLHFKNSSEPGDSQDHKSQETKQADLGDHTTIPKSYSQMATDTMSWRK